MRIESGTNVMLNSTLEMPKISEPLNTLRKVREYGFDYDSISKKVTKVAETEGFDRRMQ